VGPRGRESFPRKWVAKVKSKSSLVGTWLWHLLILYGLMYIEQWECLLLLSLGGVLRRRPPPILCLCMWLLAVKPIQGFSSLIMMYDTCIYATFYNDICFARYHPSSFCVYVVETKISFKISVHSMKTPTTCHNFWICIKIRTACMCLVVAIFFRSPIKIGPHACV
jgi:hypothetical protein